MAQDMPLMQKGHQLCGFESCDGYDITRSFSDVANRFFTLNGPLKVINEGV